MKKLTFILLVFVIIITTGCPENFGEPDSRIIIVNKTKEKTSYFYRINDKKDTLLENFPFPLTLENTKSRTIQPQNQDTLIGPFRTVLDENPENMLYLYLFSSAVIDTVPWDSIVMNYQILHRYDLTLSDLEAMNWIVEYP